MSFDHDMQMKVKDEIITDLENQVKEANEKLVESEKDRDQWIHRATLQRLDIGKLEQRLQEAEEVVRFYESTPPKELYQNDFESLGYDNFKSGKRARAYLAKHEAKQEER